MSEKKPYYITTAIAYTSGKPHIGNTYEAVLADAIARECPADDPYRDRLENVQRLLALRMVQYGAASDAMNAADAEQDEGA